MTDDVQSNLLDPSLEEMLVLVMGRVGEITSWHEAECVPKDGSAVHQVGHSSTMSCLLLGRPAFLTGIYHSWSFPY